MTARAAAALVCDGGVRRQRAWLIYDVAQRVIVGRKFVGGSMQAMMRFGCLTDLSHKRGKQFVALRWRG